MMLLSGPQTAALMQGLAWTVGLSLISFVGGGLVGFAVDLGRIATSRTIKC